MDSFERELLLKNPLIKLVLNHGGEPAVTAETVLRRELERGTPSDDELVAAERAVNDALARLSASELRTLFADTLDPKELAEVFALTVNELARVGLGTGEARALRLPHLWAWHWEKEVIAWRRFLAGGKRDHATLEQLPSFFRPGVPAKPFWTLDELGPAFRSLEETSAAIRGELAAVLHEDAWLPYRGARGERDELPVADHAASEWNGFFFYHPFRGRFSANHARCPITSRVLEALPGLCRRELVLFSALTPGSIVPPHCGPFNGRVRVHLALTGSKGCYLRVGTQIREWEDGRVLAFDDSFEHQVCHAGPAVRVVLMFAVVQPGLEPSVVDRAAQLTTEEFTATEADREAATALARAAWWK